MFLVVFDFVAQNGMLQTKFRQWLVGSMLEKKAIFSPIISWISLFFFLIVWLIFEVLNVAIRVSLILWLRFISCGFNWLFRCANVMSNLGTELLIWWLRLISCNWLSSNGKGFSQILRRVFGSVGSSLLAAKALNGRYCAIRYPFQYVCLIFLIGVTGLFDRSFKTWTIFHCMFLDCWYFILSLISTNMWMKFPVDLLISSAENPFFFLAFIWHNLTKLRWWLCLSVC